MASRFRQGDPVRLTDTNSLNQAAVVNLRRLMWLRTIAIGGAAMAVATATLSYGISLPIAPVMAILAMLAGLNLWTWRRLVKPRAVSEREFFAQMLADVSGLTGILYFTGGAANPFAVFFLLPITIAAMVLPQRYTWAMAGVTAACYTFLMVMHVPFPELSHRSGHTMFGLHVAGMWLGFVLIAGLIAYFVVGMGETLRQREQSLVTARENALRDERVVALGALAAGAAHELGTPLSTMAVVANELLNDCPQADFPELHEQLRTIQTQVHRCKDALSVVSASAGAIRAESAGVVSLSDYLNDIVAQLRASRRGVAVNVTISGTEPTPRVLAERTVTQAILNIINNAADASPDHVCVDAAWNRDEIIIEVRDSGEGINSQFLASKESLGHSTKKDGLGLGLFLSQAAIDRLGGSITLRNRAEGGAATTLRLPLSALQAGSVV